MRLKKTFTREEVAALLDGIDTMRDIERALRAAGYGKGVAAKVASRFFVRPDDDSEALSAPIVGDGVQARPDDIQTQVDLARALMAAGLKPDEALGVASRFHPRPEKPDFSRDPRIMTRPGQ
jgi:hypothetical protein